MSDFLPEETPHGSSKGLVEADEANQEDDGHVAPGVPNLRASRRFNNGVGG